MAQTRTGSSRKGRKIDHVSLVYADLEISFSDGNKPFIGRITILGDSGDEPILSKFFDSPRELRKDDMSAILDILHTNFVVCCDPSTDRQVIQHDARRCGLKAHTSTIVYLDVQAIEACVTRKLTKQRPSLESLARKYGIKPRARFHDSYSDVLAIRDVFRAQLTELNTDADHLLRDFPNLTDGSLQHRSGRSNKKG